MQGKCEDIFWVVKWDIKQRKEQEGISDQTWYVIQEMVIKVQVNI